MVPGTGVMTEDSDSTNELLFGARRYFASVLPGSYRVFFPDHFVTQSPFLDERFRERF